MDTQELVKNFIKTNHHLVLSTASPEAKPSIAPLFYVYDEAFNLYWVSSKDAVHSYNVRLNPRVAIVILDETPSDNSIRALYIDAETAELEDPADIQRAIGLLSTRPQPDKFTTKSLGDVTGEAAWRIYVARPKEFYKRVDAIDQKTDQVISVRESVTLET